MSSKTTNRVTDVNHHNITTDMKNSDLQQNKTGHQCARRYNFTITMYAGLPKTAVLLDLSFMVVLVVGVTEEEGVEEDRKEVVVAAAAVVVGGGERK